jgi:hypothetical protein
MGIHARVLSAQEQEHCDLTLSELYNWQQALDVPLADLLVDPGTPLSRPVLERARMVRLMKTAHALLKRSHAAGSRRLAQTLVEQLIEIMPELKDVHPWHTVGQRRTLEEFGRVLEQRVPDDFLRRQAE